MLRNDRQKNRLLTHWGMLRNAILVGLPLLSIMGYLVHTIFLDKRSEGNSQSRAIEAVFNGRVLGEDKPLQQISQLQFKEARGLDSPQCVSSWKQLAKMELTSLFSDLKFTEFKKSMNNSQRCQISENHPLKAVSEQVRRHCYNQVSNGTNHPGDLISGCFHSLLQLRFEAIDYLTSGIPVSAITDLEVLLAKMSAQGFKDSLSVDPKKVIELSRRILELEPENETALGFLIRGQYLESIKNRNDQVIKQFEVTTEQVSENFPFPSLLIESRIAVARLKGDFEMMKKLAVEGREGHLNEQDAKYYIAWANYMDKRDDEAKNLLKEILLSNPNHSKARASLERLNNIESQALYQSEQSIFSDELGKFRFTFSVGSVDLDSIGRQ